MCIHDPLVTNCIMCVMEPPKIMGKLTDNDVVSKLVGPFIVRKDREHFFVMDSCRAPGFTVCMCYEIETARLICKALNYKFDAGER